jgi:hypothetical protein
VPGRDSADPGAATARSAAAAAAGRGLLGDLWRADLFTTVGSDRSYDAAHYHPTFSGLVPCEREFDPRIVDDPFGWIRGRLDDIPGMLRESGHADLAAELDPVVVEGAMPAILANIRATLDLRLPTSATPAPIA